MLGASVNGAGTYTFTAATAGEYDFSWIVVNGLDGNKDSSVAITDVSSSAMAPRVYGTPVDLPMLVNLTDSDGSEALAVTISGLAAGAAIQHRHRHRRWQLVVHQGPVVGPDAAARRRLHRYDEPDDHRDVHRGLERFDLDAPARRWQ